MVETPDPSSEQPGAEQAGAETPPEAPAHRGPPIVVAEEVLDERGEDTAKLLKGVVATYALDSGGRNDIPWVRIAP